MGRTTLDRLAASDPDALAVYAAEDRAAGPLRRYRRFAELCDHVEQIVTSAFWDSTFPDAPVEVQIERRHRDATFAAAAVSSDEVAVLWFIDGHWTLDMVLHELAHVAAGEFAGHGPRFRAALIALWRNYAGIHATGHLMTELRASGFSAGLRN